MEPKDQTPLPPEVAELFERPPADEPTAATLAWLRTWSWIVAAVLVSVWAWLTYTRDGWVPFLSNVDFGIHELGHLLFAWAPMPVVAFAGSALQVTVPLGLAGYFAWRRDRFATILMTAWAGASLNNVSVYVGDARRMVLVLWGDDGTGSGHDWRYLLGPEVLDVLVATDAIASAVRGLSALLFAAAFGMAVWGLLEPRVWASRQASREAELRARRASLPVRAPRNPTQP